MDVKAGYKQTEVGVVPEDWTAIKLSAICSMKSGEGITSENIDEFSPFPCYGGNGLRGYTSRYTHDGAHALIGRQGALCGNVLGVEGKFFASEHAVVVTASAKTDIRWLTYILSEMRLNQYSESSAQPGLSVSKIVSLPVALPPSRAEQEAIAEALSDADVYIESLKQLIAKKRLIKQGAMQELLTGKRRLPEFTNGLGYKQTDIGLIPQDWNCVPLPTVMAQSSSSIKIGPFGSALKKELLTAKGFKVYGQENIYEKNMTIGDRFISTDHFRKLMSCEVKPGDFLISMMGTVGKCLVVPGNIEAGIIDSHLIRLRLDRSKLNAEYLQQLFQTRIIAIQIKQLSVGGIMEGLSSKIIKLLQLPTPEVEEQVAIASVLSDMDSEVAALEEKLTKARQIKQGMMQELLTGRIRLI